MLAKKLFVRAGSRVAVVDAPEDIDLVLGPDAKAADRGPADIVLVYANNRAAVDGALIKASKRLADAGTLWVAYPKAGKLGTDLNRDSLARALQGHGLEPVSQIAIDEVWSALRVKHDPELTEARVKRGASFGPGKKKATAKAKAKAKAAVKAPAKTAKAKSGAKAKAKTKK